MSTTSPSLCTRWSLIDIGLNLTDKMYTGTYKGRRCHKPDMDAVLERGYLGGVRGLLLTGGNRRDSVRVVEMCGRLNERRENLQSADGQPRTRFLCTVGCHPTRAGEFEADPEGYYSSLDTLIANHSVKSSGAEGNRCVAAIGEIGLDYDRLFFCPKDTQLKYFAKQLVLAEKHQLPLFLHDRNTDGDFYRIIAEHKSRFPGGVVHSFTGSQEDLQRYLDLGLYIGVNGCSLKTQENLDVVRAIPLDRIMIETDGPWCEIKSTHASRALLNTRARRLGAAQCEADALIAAYPVVKKEKFKEGAMVKDRCEPCHLVHVLEVIHELHSGDERALTMEELANIITENTKHLFPF